MKNRNEIKKLNDALRNYYEDAANIRHYQGNKTDATYLTTSRMPNTNQSGRIFAGHTDDLLSQLDRGQL
jgi:hypothetical protein